MLSDAIWIVLVLLIASVLAERPPVEAGVVA
jgi:hypothetical protein